MSNDRIESFKRAITPKKIPKQGELDAKPVSEYFGSLTFGLGQMREKLPKEAYKSLLKTLDQGKKLEKTTAEAVALAIKEWSVQKGVTHFCHWFQPMTGLTAEKHDAFVTIQHNHHSELRVIEHFSGSQLIQGEPDASSFPNGGMRSTFEARGYTAWDPSSPLFIIEDAGGRTLCIPTVFFGYHGQALDNKTPLLRSVDSISKSAVEFLKLIGDVDVKKISCTLGVEQEYFLIDLNFVAQRPDLIMTGRTLLGAASARGQQFEDHYFGSIPTRVKAFMIEVETESFKLGIPVKTRHNEVAPSQFELAPIFEDVNIASDHNAVLMDLLRRIAIRHGFMCLLHEKPFAGVNGSGKHNNWSIANDKGENLLEPGHTPHQNLRFLAVLSAILKAVFENSSALRASIASPGNDHRLGANEAPPAIISVFLGSMLDDILNTIEAGKSLKGEEQQILDLGVGRIPDISKDYTDRNRTSPFAFTGNKFEFRAVGSSANVAVPMTFLNAAVAEAFKTAAIELKNILEEKKSRDEAVFEWIRRTIKETKVIRFAGNGYSDEWKAEAKKRGLPILNSTADALPVLGDKKHTQFLIDANVLSAEEIASRYHVYVERYIKTLDLEMDVLIELAQSYVIPTIEKQMSLFARSRASAATEAFQSHMLSQQVNYEKSAVAVFENLKNLETKILVSREIHNEEKRMRHIVDVLKPAAEALRTSCDQTEQLTANEIWPLPKYREMLLANSLT